MDTIAPAVLLLAKILLLGPEGTVTISEHRARIPAGVAGLLRERIDERGLPAEIAVEINPAASKQRTAGGPAAIDLEAMVKVDLWLKPAPSPPGPPDETNRENVLLSSGVSTLVQLAEDPSGSKRLVLSLRVIPPGEEETAAILTGPPPSPVEVAFRVEAFRERGGVREMVGRHVLRTLSGLPVSCESSYRKGAVQGASTPPPVESLTLSLKPTVLLGGGWVTVESSLIASLLSPEGSDSPVTLRASESKTVPFGIPFAMILDSPAGQPPRAGAGSDPGPAERYLVEITAFLPAAAPDTRPPSPR